MLRSAGTDRGRRYVDLRARGCGTNTLAFMPLGYLSLRGFLGNFLLRLVVAVWHREGADYMRACNTANSRLCYKMHRVPAPPCFLPAGILRFPQLRGPLDQVPASRYLAC